MVLVLMVVVMRGHCNCDQVGEDERVENNHV